MHVTKWKKKICKGYLLYDSNYKTFWKRQNYEDSKKGSCQGLEGKERDKLEGWIGRRFGEQWKFSVWYNNDGFSSVTQSCLTLCDPMDGSTPGFSVHHQLPELAQTHFHWVSDAIQPSHPLSSPSSPAFNLSQHQGLFQWVSSFHQVAKVLEFQLQHQSFQWIFGIDFL